MILENKNNNTKHNDSGKQSELNVKQCIASRPQYLKIFSSKLHIHLANRKYYSVPFTVKSYHLLCT